MAPLGRRAASAGGRLVHSFVAGGAPAHAFVFGDVGGVLRGGVRYADAIFRAASGAARRLPASFAALHVRRGDFAHAANATAEDFYHAAAPLLAPGEAVYAATDADPSFLDAFRARGHAVTTRADLRDVFDAAGLSEDMHGPAEQLVATLGRAFVGSEGPSGRVFSEFAPSLSL